MASAGRRSAHSAGPPPASRGSIEFSPGTLDIVPSAKSNGLKSHRIPADDIAQEDSRKHNLNLLEVRRCSISIGKVAIKAHENIDLAREYGQGNGHVRLVTDEVQVASDCLVGRCRQLFVPHGGEVPFKRGHLVRVRQVTTRFSHYLLRKSERERLAQGSEQDCMRPSRDAHASNQNVGIERNAEPSRDHTARDIAACESPSPLARSLLR